MTEDERAVVQAVADFWDGRVSERQTLDGFAVDDCLFAGWVYWEDGTLHISAKGRQALKERDADA